MAFTLSKSKLVFFVAIMFVAYATLIYLHEQSHVQIYRSYGLNAKMDYYIFGGSVTPGGLENLSETDLKIVTALNVANEVYGYQIITILIAFFGTALLFLIGGLKE